MCMHDLGRMCAYVKEQVGVHSVQDEIEGFKSGGVYAFRIMFVCREVLVESRQEEGMRGRG